jgi:PKD repeat protein
VYLKAFGNNGCPSDSVVVPLRLDSVIAEFSQGLNSVIQGNAINFINQSVNGHTYVWNFFDGDPSFEANPWHFYNNPGTFSVKLTATTAHNCSDSIMKAAIINVQELTTGILSADGLNGILVYPNPAYDFLYIQGSGENIQGIVIYDIAGKVVIEKEYEGIDNFSVNVSFLNSGLYIIQIKTGSYSKTFKFVKQ